MHSSGARTSARGLMKPFLILGVRVATGFGWTSRGASQRQAQQLFNGKDLTGWHVDVPAADSNARLRSPFVVRNGVLVSLGEPRGISSPIPATATTGWRS